MNSNSLIGIFLAVLLVGAGLYAAMHFYLAETDEYAQQWASTGKLISGQGETDAEGGEDDADKEFRASDATISIQGPGEAQGVWVSSAREAVVIVDSEDAAEIADRADSDDDIEAQKQQEEQNEPSSSEETTLSKSERRKAEILASVKNPSQKQKPLVRAVIVQMTFDEVDCNETGFTTPAIGVDFRYGSAAIKGTSLNTLDKVVEAYRSCPGILHLFGSAVAYVDGGEALMERRKQEVKYYLLQRRVPKEKIELKDPI